MGFRDRLMAIFQVLRDPATKPADVDALDNRLDEVERRLRERKARAARIDAQAGYRK